MSAPATITGNDPVGSAGAGTADRPVRTLGTRRIVTDQQILVVRFRSPEGRFWDAVGGGATLAAAIQSARESCPDDTAWTVLGWSDLYGD